MTKCAEIRVEIFLLPKKLCQGRHTRSTRLKCVCLYLMLNVPNAPTGLKTPLRNHQTPNENQYIYFFISNLKLSSLVHALARAVNERLTKAWSKIWSNLENEILGSNALYRIASRQKIMTWRRLASLSKALAQ